mmetsp:Transcript_23532/g.54641  ORF Transcript_23532/g.54641 Transcript_23532/m.54641 type:complete len:291 (+) Transcript_23532:89-961(+)
MAMVTPAALYGGEAVVRGDASQRQTAPVPWMFERGLGDRIPCGLDSAKISLPWLDMTSPAPGYAAPDLYGDINSNFMPSGADGFAGDGQALGEKPKESVVDKTAFRKQFKKTQMCRFFQRSACRKGDLCEFAHGPEELTRAPDLRRTSLCKAFMEGCCTESAESCRFAHGIALLRRTPGFEKLVAASKNKAASEDTQNEDQSTLHEMLKKQQQQQEEMRMVIEEQRRRINELKMQQEQLQLAQYASSLQNQLPLAQIPSLAPQPTLLPKPGAKFPEGLHLPKNYEKMIPL